MDTLEIRIPTAVIGQVQNQRLIQAAFLEMLARLTDKDPLPLSGAARIEYDPMGEPAKRSETWGDKAYGLELEADPIASGYGVHGEHGRWRFYGLPAGVELRGSHTLDLRGGPGNYLALTFRCASPEQEALIRQGFGREIQAVIAYDRAH